MTEVPKSFISSGTRSQIKIDKLEQQLIEAEKANFNLKNENTELKEKLNLVTEELRELKLKKGNSNFFFNRSSRRKRGMASNPLFIQGIS